MNSNIIFVEGSDLTNEEHIKGFVNVYKEAFGGPPYYESYSDEDVIQDVWMPHVETGCIIVAIDTSSDIVIGLSCAMPVLGWKHDDEFQSFISRNMDKVPDLEKTCFMTEVAVLTKYRRQGIGTQLVKSRIDWARRKQMTHYMMRTAQEGSNSISLYQKLGARQIKGLTQDVSSHAQEVCSESLSRIYLLGKI